MRYRFFIIAVVACFSALPALARDAYFLPAVGEVLDASAGQERVVVRGDGAIELYSYQGDILPGFPLFIQDQVVASSPIIADIGGDAYKEIVFFTHDANNAYRVYAINGQGEEVGNANIARTVYADPISVPQANGDKDDIVYINEVGEMKRLRFSNNQFVEDVLFNMNTSGGALATSPDGERIHISLPLVGQVRRALRNGDGWFAGGSVGVPSPIVYPVVEAADEYLYGVNRDGDVVAVHKDTNEFKAGFPVSLPFPPVGEITLSDMSDAYAGEELVVKMSNGQVQVVSRTGELVEEIGDQQFYHIGVPTDDVAMQSFFDSVGRGTHGLVTSVGQTVSSWLSRIRNVLTQTSPVAVVTREGAVVEQQSAYAFGSVEVGGEQTVTYTVANEGTGDLTLSANYPAIVADAVGVFEIVGAPERIVAPGQSTDVVVRFAPQAAGEYSATLEIQHNDENTSPLTVALSGIGFVNLVQDGNMEAPGVEAWRNYGVPAVKEKHNTAHAGDQSMHIDTQANGGGGMQQLDIPVEAGQWYTFGFWYRIDAGELRPRLGINSSNSDFELHYPVLRNTQGEFVYYERTFQVPADYVDGFRIVMATKVADVYIDNIAITPTAAPGLVKDGAMDTSHVAYWENYGAPNIKEKRAQDGNSYLFVQHTDGGAGVLQRNIDVEPGQHYIVRFRYQFPEGERLRAVLNLRSFGNNADLDGIYNNLPKTAPGEWKWYERQIEIPADNNDDLMIYWAMRTGAGQERWFMIDDVDVVPVDPMLVLDGDMEAPHMANWGNYGVPDVLEKRSAGGNQYVYLEETNGGAGVRQSNIQVEPGRIYTLRFRYQFEQGERARPILNIRGFGGNNSDFEEIYRNLRRTQAGEWGWYERQFTVPAEAENSLSFWVVIRSGDNATGVFVMDDVTVEESIVEYVRDGDMEANHLAAWLDYGPIDAKQKDADAHTGNQSLYIERNLEYEPSLGAQQVALPVEAGQQYRLSFWYKGDAMLLPRLANNDSNTDYESTVTYLYPQRNAWREYERVFTAPQDLGEFRLVFVVDRFYYDFSDGTQYAEIFLDGQGNMFVDGVLTEGLAPDAFNTLQPETAFIRIDDVTIEPVQ